MANDYSKQTVVQLKKLATERGISAALKSGLRKADIIEKIQEFDADMLTQEATDPVPATEERVVEAPAVVEHATVVQVSGVDGEPSDEPVAPTHHEPIQPVQQDSIPEPTVEKAPSPKREEVLPENTADVEATTNDEPLPSTASESKAEAETYTTQPSSDLTTPVPTEEILEDSRKRKRRSVTPPVHAAEIAAKRQRHEEVLDTDAAISDAPPQAAEPTELQEQAAGDKPDRNSTAAATEPMMEVEPPMQDTPAKGEAPVAPKIPTGPRKWSNDLQSRTSQTQDSSDTHAKDDDDKATGPAIHHATAALYIRNFQRPLHPKALEKYLVSLASPPSADSDETIIRTLHLDQVKTHALVLFSSTAAASRVRSSLHGRVWPAETHRRELWIDFIPDEKIMDWIDKENQNNSGKTGGRRWEVVYIHNEEGVMEAIHQEEGSNPASAPRQPSGQGLTVKGSSGPPPNAPLGPRGSTVQTRPSVPHVSAPGTIPPAQTSVFKSLDERFKRTTTAKGNIYWDPVSDDVVEKRKEEFKLETGRDWTPAKWKDEDELFRYTFEDNRIVHSGPHSTSLRVRDREANIIGGPRRGGAGGGGRGGRNGGGYEDRGGRHGAGFDDRGGRYGGGSGYGRR